jgi:hypothetical protein
MITPKEINQRNERFWYGPSWLRFMERIWLFLRFNYYNPRIFLYKLLYGLELRIRRLKEGLLK